MSDKDKEKVKLCIVFGGAAFIIFFFMLALTYDVVSSGILALIVLFMYIPFSMVSFRNSTAKNNYLPEKDFSERVEEIFEEYTNLDIEEKIKFLISLPNNEIFYTNGGNYEEEKEAFLTKYDISEEEYQALFDKIDKLYSKGSDASKKIIFNIKNKIYKKYKIDNAKYYECRLLSTSNLELDKERYKIKGLIFSKNKVLFSRSKVDLFENDDIYFSSLLMAIKEYANNKYISYEIKYDDIIYYASEGSKTINTIVSGGGLSGKIDEFKARKAQRREGDLTLLGGDAAAIESMLSDLKIEPIETRLVEKDERILIIKTKSHDFAFTRITNYKKYIDLYMILINYLPEKDIARVSVKEPKETSSNNDTLDEIKKLKELLDIGAITQEEFDDKKKELLNKI